MSRSGGLMREGGRKAGDRFPGVSQKNERRLPDDFVGPVSIWDIDNTYLDTNIESMRSMLKIALEKAIDKRSVQGTVPLLQELRHGPQPEPASLPLYFISASPPQLRKVLERKMLLDGVEYDGITLKDQLWWVRHGRLRGLKRHTRYKLSALFLLFRDLPPGSDLYLFGDDTEDDADIYATFTEVVCGETSPSKLERYLRRSGVRRDELRRLIDLVSGLSPRQAVGRIFIRMVKGDDHRKIEERHPALLASDSFLTVALDLRRRGLLRPEAPIRLARHLMEHSGLSASELRATLRDAEEREVCDAEDAEALAEQLDENDR